MAFWNQGGADFSNLKPALMPEEMGDAPEPSGFLESTGDALQAGLMTTGTAAWQLATVPAIAADWVKSKATGVETTEQQDLMFSNVIDPAVQYVDSLSHRERTMAGSLSFGIGKVLTEFAGGGAPSMAVAEFSGRSTSEIRGGNSVMDANLLALNQAAWAYAGARLPGALGGSLTTKIATGAGINVVAGIGQRSTELGLMTMQGDARAADISVFGLQDMLVDAVLGAAFGPLDSARTKGMEQPDGRAIDGAMLMDRARFEDVQVGVRAPDVMAKVDRGIAEHVRAMQEHRPAVVERLPDEVTMPARDGAFAKVGSDAYRENLRAWMGDSKVVDGQGGPVVMYHGTGADFNAANGPISLTSKPEVADFYAKNNPQGQDGAPNVMPVFVKLRNPKEVDSLILQVDRYDGGEFVRQAMADGHDGLVPIGWKPGMQTTEIVVFDPNQIKSAIGNSGRFDLESGNLTDLVDVTELDVKLKNMAADEIAAALGIKPDPDMKAMQAEITTLRDSQIDLSQPIVPDVDPAAMAEVRAQAQAIIDGRAVAKITDDGAYVTASNEHGKIGGVVDGDSVRINFVEVAESARGRGHGKSLYKTIIDDSFRKGRKVYSDKVIEADAVRVYESLKREGYVIRDNSAGPIDDGDGAIYGRQEGPVYEVVSAPDHSTPGAANDPDVTEATAFADRVKSIRDVMGCLLRIGA